jgi:NACHT domain
VILAIKIANKRDSEYFPIHIPLRYGFNRINEDGDSLDAILSTLQSDTKILFIFDALDEFDQDNVYRIRDRISTYQGKYVNSKAIITTRPNHNFRQLVEPDNYVKLCRFNIDQVNEFFSKYGIDLDYNSALASGLGLDEISKPLFCWMVSLVHVKNKSLVISSSQLNYSSL